MFESLKLWFQPKWGAVKRSKMYNMFAAGMSILPLVDIVTDYVFIGLTLSSGPTELEKAIAFTTIFCLYLSSRLVVVLSLVGGDRLYVTFANIIFFYIPFTFVWYIERDVRKGKYERKLYYLWKKYNIKLDDIGCVKRFTFYFLCLFSIPLIHFAFVIYCVFHQISTHILDRRDHPPFVAVTFVELSESIPQIIFQSILFWADFDSADPWSTKTIVYILSMVASIVAILKSLYVYCSRFDIAIQGFTARRMDDIAYLRELARDPENNQTKFLKVFERMKYQGEMIEEQTDDDGWSLLMGLAAFGQDDNIEYLHSCGADIEAKDGFI